MKLIDVTSVAGCYMFMLNTTKILNEKDKIPWTVISDVNGEEMTRSFYEKELQKVNQKEFRIEKIIKRKGNKLYVKWKGYDSSFNSYIDKKDLV